MFEFDFGKAAKLSPEELNEQKLLLAATYRSKFEKVKNEKNISKKIESEIENFEKNLNLVIDLNTNKLSNYNFKNLTNIIEYSKRYHVPVNIYLTGGSQFKNPEKVQMLFDNKALSTLQKLNQTLIANGMNEIKFTENVNDKNTAWTMNQVLIANQKIDEAVKQIKAQKLSPYEAMAFIHNLAIQFIYKENKENKAISRSLVGITNTDYIVCMGYSTFVKAIIDKLEMKGLSCDTLTSTLTETEKSEWLTGIDLPNFGSGHQSNVIHIKDPKYKVSGTYISDSCFDSVNPKIPGLISFANFMFPVTDLLSYKGLEFDQPHKDLISMIESIIGDKSVADKNQLPIIKNYASDSKPIPLDTLKRCLFNTFKKIYSNTDEIYIINYVDKIIEDSKLISKSTFNENAKNAIASTAYQEYAALNQPGA